MALAAPPALSMISLVVMSTMPPERLFSTEPLANSQSLVPLVPASTIVPLLLSTRPEFSALPPLPPPPCHGRPVFTLVSVSVIASLRSIGEAGAGKLPTSAAERPFTWPQMPRKFSTVRAAAAAVYVPVSVGVVPLLLRLTVRLPVDAL